MKHLLLDSVRIEVMILAGLIVSVFASLTITFYKIKTTQYLTLTDTRRDGNGEPSKEYLQSLYEDYVRLAKPFCPPFSPPLSVTLYDAPYPKWIEEAYKEYAGPLPYNKKQKLFKLDMPSRLTVSIALNSNHTASHVHKIQISDSIHGRTHCQERPAIVEYNHKGMVVLEEWWERGERLLLRNGDRFYYYKDGWEIDEKDKNSVKLSKLNKCSKKIKKHIRDYYGSKIVSG